MKGQSLSILFNIYNQKFKDVEAIGWAIAPSKSLNSLPSLHTQPNYAVTPLTEEMPWLIRSIPIDHSKDILQNLSRT